MRFAETYTGWQEGRLTQADVGRLLGVSERRLRRQSARFEAEGMQGLIDRRMAQISSRRAPVDEVLVSATAPGLAQKVNNNKKE